MQNYIHDSLHTHIKSFANIIQEERLKSFISNQDKTKARDLPYRVSIR